MSVVSLKCAAVLAEAIVRAPRSRRQLKAAATLITRVAVLMRLGRERMGGGGDESKDEGDRRQVKEILCQGAEKNDCPARPKAVVVDVRVWGTGVGCLDSPALAGACSVVCGGSHPFYACQGNDLLQHIGGAVCGLKTISHNNPAIRLVPRGCASNFFCHSTHCLVVGIGRRPPPSSPHTHTRGEGVMPSVGLNHSSSVDGTSFHCELQNKTNNCACMLRRSLPRYNN